MISGIFAYLEDLRVSTLGIASLDWNMADEIKFYTTPLPIQHGRDHAPVHFPYFCFDFTNSHISMILTLSPKMPENSWSGENFSMLFERDRIQACFVLTRLFY